MQFKYAINYIILCVPIFCTEANKTLSTKSNKTLSTISNKILSTKSNKPKNPLSDKFIEKLSFGNNSWTAGRNFPRNASIATIKSLMGTIFTDPYYKIISNVTYKLVDGFVLPPGFDSRITWKDCTTLKEIREQGACASCWAIVAAATMTDRYCIHSNSLKHFYFSSGDLHTCCIHFGCLQGGYASMAWQYWNLVGIVSGGVYGSKEGCRPFTIPPCDFDAGCNKTVKLPACVHKCRTGYETSYKADKAYGERIYSIKTGEEQIKMEIFKNGPVQAVLRVYTDFLSYKSGVYRKVAGDYLGGHSVKLLGWGIEHGYKFWIAANSWGERWGDGGFFKIIRGVNHCGIESLIMAGTPNYKKTALRKNINLNIDNKIKLQIDWDL